MKFGSVCSGIEAASVAWESLGFEAQWFSEIEHFPSEVLKHRYPTVPNLGDMTKLTTNETFRGSTIDILVGGTPCQSFSVAGLRGGLADPRGNLMLTFLGLADAKKPRWIVWENVPGVLSSNGGKDFGTFLGALGELGYGSSYRVLDAQYFGVAQRRRRVFVVGYLGDWRPAAAVLFERESLSGHPKQSRKKGQEVASDAQGGVGATGYVPRLSNALCARDYKGARPEADQGAPVVAQPIQICFNDANETRSDRPKGGCYITENPQTSPTITQAESDLKVLQPIAVDTYNQSINEHTTQTITSSASDSNHIGAVLQPSMAIRRLTPKECERLQGFPDDWTKISYRNKPADQCPDGPRYKACGNSMAVPVMRWIGKRIQLIDTIIN
jgi:DNA (cytosine-5)-methyltransferase 1